jgi:iron complex transport system substrate-binding protein
MSSNVHAPRRRVGRFAALTALTALAALVTGCGGSSSGQPSAASSAASASVAPAAGAGKKTQYPVQVTDCRGRSTTYDKAPSRIVTFDPTVAETLLQLGLKDKIVGVTQWGDKDWWPATQAEMKTLKVINQAPNYPTKEAVVAASPDIVMSIYESALIANKTLPTREQWSALGVNSYLVRMGCDNATAEMTDLNLLYQDIRNIGTIFDVQDKAEAVVARMQADVVKLQDKAKAAGVQNKTVWTYDASDDNGVFDGNSPENAIMRLSGTTNLFADSLKGYTPMSYEEVVKRKPDAVWIVTSSGDGFIEEVDKLEAKLVGDARVNGLDAVKNKKFIVVSYIDAVPSPRIIDALSDYVDALVAVK